MTNTGPKGNYVQKGKAQMVNAFKKDRPERPKEGLLRLAESSNWPKTRARYGPPARFRPISGIFAIGAISS
jgi:hypothetical protein